MADIARMELAPGYEISRLIRGCWQLAGGHGAVLPGEAMAGMAAYFDAGITTFDGADIYTGVEELIGHFRKSLEQSHGAKALTRLKVHTKFVPDLDVLPAISRAYVRRIITRSLRRLNMERLDLVQFHWWDYEVPRVVETALWLSELRQEGLIAEIGGTNFDRAHLCALVDAGVPLRAMQVQYSLLDHRPATALAGAAQAHGVQLLCYGTLAGGFLTERWLGRPEPGGEVENRSLVKYKLIIDEFGGWELFQTLLQTLAPIAQAHETDIGAIACRYILDQPGVAAIILGARGESHLPATLRIDGIRLTPADRAQIAAVLAQRRGPSGEVYALERDRLGRHGAIMKYNLNGAA